VIMGTNASHILVMFFCKFPKESSPCFQQCTLEGHTLHKPTKHRCVSLPGNIPYNIPVRAFDVGDCNGMSPRHLPAVVRRFNDLQAQNALTITVARNLEDHNYHSLHFKPVDMTRQFNYCFTILETRCCSLIRMICLRHVPGAEQVTASQPQRRFASAS